MTKLLPGDIIAGLEPDEHVQIRSLTQLGEKVLIDGIGERSRREIRRPVSVTEIERLTKIRGSNYSFDGDSRSFLLGMEATRIQIAYQFDPLFAVNSSVVDVLPHQVEAVYRYLLPLPRIRFLLADDTGAGKTIMTGLLIKELLFRGIISKVLIITPGGLTGQWRDEMIDKFGLPFRLINRATFDAEPGQFARNDEGAFITSIDFISRNEGCLNAAKETPWDIIVVDEAHKLSAYEYGTKVDKNERYQAIEALSTRTDHLLFLTATPHRGRKDTFRRLLMLLDQDLFQKDELVTERLKRQAQTVNLNTEQFEAEAAINEARNRFFLRRLKEEMVDWNGNQLFKPRHTNTVGYNLTPEEYQLYLAVTAYVRSRRKQAKEKKNRNVELALVVMQRRLASSIYAITKTLENRLNSLEYALDVLKDAQRKTELKALLRGSENDIPTSYDDYEEQDDIQREDVDKKIFRYVLSDNPEEVAKEKSEVIALLEMARALKNHKEAKFSELLRVLDSSDVIRREEEKLVIFTEHKHTLDNLQMRLSAMGYSVTTIHGGMDIEMRKQAQREFRTRSKIMIATDAAGEGINLQFCRYLINWDIPWNPNRLEQRMGRIHRYGQLSDVWVYNLVATNTREGSVLQRVLTKLDQMREQMGTDRVYDVIDELLDDVPLVELIERSIDEDSPDDVCDDTDRLLSNDKEGRAEELINLQKKASLASHLDMRQATELRDASDERRLQPIFVQNFFFDAYRAASGMITEDNYYPVFTVGKVPSVLLEVARQNHFPITESYLTPFVFDKNLVSVASRTAVPDGTRMIGPGHPLFETLIMWALKSSREAFTKGTVLIDPNIASPQRIWIVRSKIEDERREERVRTAHEKLAVVIEDHLGLRSTSPANLLIYTTPDSPIDLPTVDAKSNDEIQLWTYEYITEPQKKQVTKHRQTETDLRRTYLTHTFSELISELQSQLEELQRYQLYGDDKPEERQKLEQRVQQLKDRKIVRLEELELMMRLRANLPEIITSAVVIPSPIAMVVSDDSSLQRGVPMRRDDEVERIAMDVVMRFERSRGWHPTDVSQDGEHYDIRSESPDGQKRFIEVKGRATTGAIVITSSERDKLAQLKDRAFLYIVTQCRSALPRLRIIPNPMDCLNPEQWYRQVQYLVQLSDWQHQGEEYDLSALN